MKMIPLTLGSLMLIVVVSCKTKDENPYGNKLGEIAAKADPVKTEGELIRSGEFALELVSNGKLEAVTKASVFFAKNDLITRIYCQNGDWVEKGNLLAELDSRDEDILLKQARTGIEKSNIELRSQIIAHTGGSDQQNDVNSKALETMKLKSGYSDAELNLEQRELSYQDCFLRAPVSGRIANLDVKPFNPPIAGKPFCIILDDREFDVVFNVLESELARIKVGQTVLVRPFALDSLQFKGRIVDINPLIDENSMVSVRARIQNHSRNLVEGMNVKVFISFTVPGGLIIPKEALVLRNNRQVVFSLKNGRSYWNYVETGFENSNSYTVNVVSGVLVAGDTIITKGNLNLAHDVEIDFRLTENK